MIRSLIVILVIIIASTIGLSVYLQPDDLRNCERAPSSNFNCQPVDAIVAVSGGDTEARAMEAVYLYKNGWADIIIFSGAAKDKTGPSNAAVMKNIAIESGVQDSVILIDEYAETTKENAQNAQKIFTEHDIKSVILVTSGYHQRRASLEFNKYTNDVNILNHSAKDDKNWSNWWWATPSGWWLAVGELARIIAFYVVGA
ncbi:MAG TPA: YdcF family protein [Candidatus Angelobacter sp.]|nr:YdcF family protein [Candidatus Angelobacter sp.]